MSSAAFKRCGQLMRLSKTRPITGTVKTLSSTSVDNKSAQWVPHGKGKLPFVGGQLGDRDDHDFWANINPEWKGPPYASATYRDAYPDSHPNDVMMHKIMASFFFFWIFYHSYYHLGHVLGFHDIDVKLSDFTDAELGIPPDDAADPEYWGYAYHTTRQN